MGSVSFADPLEMHIVVLHSWSHEVEIWGAIWVSVKNAVVSCLQDGIVSTLHSGSHIMHFLTSILQNHIIYLKNQLKVALKKFLQSPLKMWRSAMLRNVLILAIIAMMVSMILAMMVSLIVAIIIAMIVALIVHEDPILSLLRLLKSGWMVGMILLAKVLS
jgi:hypothetical protein